MTQQVKPDQSKDLIGASGSTGNKPGVYFITHKTLHDWTAVVTVKYCPVFSLDTEKHWIIFYPGEKNKEAVDQNDQQKNGR